MFYKLAIKNVKKSINDYIIYFMTIAFGICLFYVFNSLEAQESILKLRKSQEDILSLLTMVISVLSVFVSIVLAFLMIYANQFLIKRRKHELGIYMTLGMDKSKVSRILIIETMIIGIFAMVTGLIIGILASQGLAVLTAKMFIVKMDEFKLIFSMSAMIKSIIYFFIIFLVVMIFNTVSINKLKLIDLLNASKKNEKLKVKKLWVSVVIFIISVICLVTAYILMLNNGMLSLSPEFMASLVLGTIGTFLFFLSLSGFVLRIAKNMPKLYYKGLNMFVLRQINSRITTTFVSMTIICIMLLVSIGVLASGAGLTYTFSDSLKKVTPFDVSIRDTTDYKESISTGEDIIAKIKELSILTDEDIKSLCIINTYFDQETKCEELLKYYVTSNLMTEEARGRMEDEKVATIALSEYNKMLEVIGEKPIELKKNEVAILANYPEIKEAFEELIINGDTIVINNTECTYYKELQEYATYTTMTTMEGGTLIVPDEIMNTEEKYMVVVDIMLNADNIKQAQRDFDDKYLEYEEAGKVSYTAAYTREYMYEQNSGLTVFVCYIAVYIGLVFIITAAVILALQQLSENSDNQERYRLLRKLGTEEKDISKSIFMQTAISFLTPLALAIVHSIFGLKTSNEVISYFGYSNAIIGIIVSAIVIVFIYGGYMFATYLQGLRIMKK